MSNEEICATWADPLDRLAGTLYTRDLGIWRAGVQSWQDAEGFLAQLEQAEAVRGAAYPSHLRIEILCAWRDAEINARDEQDRATGAAFRRLVESGEGMVDIGIVADGVITVAVDNGCSGFCLSLPEAVFKVLGPVVE